MPRNIRNEIYIAVAALVIIGFALVFAILLSGTRSDDLGENGTSVAEVTANATEIKDTDTAESPETPSKTATSTATPTDIAATDTPQTVVSPSPVASETDSDISDLTVETDDNTLPIDAIRRNTATPSPTVVPTETNTNTVTNTIAPTDTARPVPTNTAQASPTATTVPTDTAQASPTATTVPEIILSPTVINVASGIIPTPPPSPTVESPDEPTRTPTNCQLPQGWATYVVQSGNTLFAIALATGSTVDELRQVNCIANIDNIDAGDVLFVPRSPQGTIATRPPTEGRAGLSLLGCSDFHTQITSPVNVQRLRGTFIVYGSAFRDDFWYYKIEIRPDWADVYNFYSRSETPVMSGVLAEVNSEIFGEGLHWVRLSVVDLGANIQPDAICEIPVIFE